MIAFLLDCVKPWSLNVEYQRKCTLPAASRLRRLRSSLTIQSAEDLFVTDVGREGLPGQVVKPVARWSNEKSFNHHRNRNVGAIRWAKQE
jgi:hypothetical protein